MTDHNEAMRLADEVSAVADRLQYTPGGFYGAETVGPLNQAAALIRQQAERIAELEARVHTCGPTCSKAGCINRRITTERDTLRAELETERMRLVACGVVAMANTAESAAKARDMHPDYLCASVRDVAAAVDREMALRAEVERLRNAMTVPTIEPNSQNWAGMDGAIAFHLIERHADSWADAGRMMSEWREANDTARKATP